MLRIRDIQTTGGRSVVRFASCRDECRMEYAFSYTDLIGWLGLFTLPHGS